jgi:dihydrofolate synthase / folylpolyglutamate synthase
MGGRLDSTNVITPLVSVITNIGLDHTQFLGTTLSAIAVEKAGIIKQGIPVIIGETQAETEPVFREFSKKLNSEITFADQQMLLKKSKYTKHRPPFLSAEFQPDSDQYIYSLTSPLSGKYQLKNMATALAVIEELQQTGIKITGENVTSGVRHVLKNTGLMGRWQTISLNPLTIADIGHNPDGIREVLEQLALTPYNKLHFVIGVVNDKDVRTMLSKLPKEAMYYFCKADIPRGLDASELKNSHYEEKYIQA